MTVNTVETRKTYNGNGITDAFATPYFLADADLAVYVGGVLQTITTDYTVSGAGIPAGGTVTFVTPPPTGTANVIVIRDPALTQLTDWVENDANGAEVKETAFDKLTMIAQRQQDKIDRTLRLQDSDLDVDMKLPLKSTRVNKFLAFNGDGEPVASAFGSMADGQVFSNKAAAVAYIDANGITNGQAYFITSNDGGPFTGVTGASAATYADDSTSYCGTQFIPTGGDGSAALVRKDAYPISVLWYGAHPSASAAVNDTAFNEALVAGTGASVYVPSGTYNKSATCVIYGKTTFYGDGWGTQLYTTVDDEMIYNSTNDGTTFDDSIHISGMFLNRQTASHAATKHIRLNSCLRAKVSDMFISDSEHTPTISTQSLGGIWFEKSGSATAAVNWVDSCNLNHAEIILDCSDSKVTRNYIWSHGTRTCIRVNDGGNVIALNDLLPSPIDGAIYGGGSAFGTQISGNNFDGSFTGVLSGHGILLESSYGSRVEDNYFYWMKRDGLIFKDMLYSVASGNTFKDGNRANETTTRGAVAIESLVINNGAGYSTGAGITMTVDATTENLWVGDVINFTGGGIFTLTISAARGVTSVTGDLTVAAVVDNEKGYKEYSDIVIQSTSFGSNSNNITGNTHWITETRLENGNAIVEANRGSSSGVNNITNNVTRITNYNTPSIVRSNTSTKLRDNRGGGSESYLSGTATVLNGTNSITVTHNSNYLPKTHEINIIPTTQLNTATSWAIINLTSTSFDIQTNVNVGADFTVAWSIDIP